MKMRRVYVGRTTQLLRNNAQNNSFNFRIAQGRAVQTALRVYLSTQVSKVRVIPSSFLVNGEAPFSVSLAFRPRSCAMVNVAIEGWPFDSTVFPSHVLQKSAEF